MRPASVEEYDAAARRCPGLCPLLLAGDRRSGRQASRSPPLPRGRGVL